MIKKMKINCISSGKINGHSILSKKRKEKMMVITEKTAVLVNEKKKVTKPTSHPCR